MSEAIPGRRYRHFKGAEYQVLHVAKHTETGEDLVVYRRVEPASSKIWVRPRAMFEGDKDGVPRFLLLGKS